MSVYASRWVATYYTSAWYIGSAHAFLAWKFGAIHYQAYMYLRRDHMKYVCLVVLLQHHKGEPDHKISSNYVVLPTPILWGIIENSLKCF